jgi:sialic acid synthase SpsE/mannose-6-phosphate isomerase-like protein (cupin superfamily)
MKPPIPTPLFVLEMANNHMGDVEHGIRIVREFKEVTRDFPQFKFSIKLQHRSDSFFHPDYLTRTDYKYIKRFTETKLSKEEISRLTDAIRDHGFITMCTPWDEPSVDLMEELKYDIIKIASCSFQDWPLLERAVKSTRPLIASTAAAETEDIDRVVSFFSHRDKSFAIMHCVGEYPCLREHLELNQIDFLKRRYPGVLVGFSTHEDPDNLDSVRVAVAKGALIFEKHIAVPTEKYAKNAYSATPAQVGKWLEAAADAFTMCGVVGVRKPIFEKEVIDIEPLYRGAFAARDIKAGEKIRETDMFLAMPNLPGQIVHKNVSKYIEFQAKRDFKFKEPLLFEGVEVRDLRARVKEITGKLRAILKERNIALPPYVEIEISHHLGLDRFDEWGAILIKIINRLYSKMLVVMFAGQSYPRHKHLEKDETYHLLYGDLIVEADGEETLLGAGDVLSINRGTPHSFRTRNGAVIEEVATTYIQGDSVYEDPAISANPNRKIYLTFWPEWLRNERPLA